MFVLIARYTRPADEVDSLLDEHKAWIDRHQQAGRILMTARQVPLIGGMILAEGESMDEMRRMVEEDPFATSGFAEYDILEFEPARVTEGMEQRLRP
jgi:uncharacterized protein YciI